MAKKESAYDKLAYILFEGETEDLFYKEVLKRYLKEGIPRKYKNLETGSGINKKAARHIINFLKEKENTNLELHVYVFIDREGPSSKIPEFNEKAIKEKVREVLNTRKVLRIAKIEAIQMIESWFLYDLEGICKYIGLEYTKSLANKYANTEKFNSRDMAELFRKGSKKRYYKKGDESFLKSLDIDRIYNNCNDLKNGIEMINNDFK